MKYFPAFLLLLYSTIFMGFFDVLEDISLNSNGSGNYSLTFDMDNIINDPFMKEMILESVKNEGNLPGGDGARVELDSTLYLKDDPQFAGLKDNRALWESAKIHTVISEDKGKMFVNFSFDFNEVGDIDTFFKKLNENKESQNMLSGFEQIMGGGAFVFKKKSLTRLPAPKSDQSQNEAMNSEDMAMLKMFMTEAKLKTTYNLPGSVKKSSIPNAVVNNKAVTVEIPLLDVMEGTAKMDGEIKFRN